MNQCSINVQSMFNVRLDTRPWTKIVPIWCYLIMRRYLSILSCNIDEVCNWVCFIERYRNGRMLCHRCIFHFMLEDMKDSATYLALRFCPLSSTTVLWIKFPPPPSPRARFLFTEIFACPTPTCKLWPLPKCRCLWEGKLHNSCPWWCWTNDSGHAHEEHSACS